MLGYDIGDPEDEVFWRGVLRSLHARGLAGVRLDRWTTDTSIMRGRRSGSGRARALAFRGGDRGAIFAPVDHAVTVGRRRDAHFEQANQQREAVLCEANDQPWRGAQLRRSRSGGTSLLVAGPVTEKARKAGFIDVRPLEPWQSTRVGDLTVTAAPGKYGVYEVTVVISGSRTCRE